VGGVPVAACSLLTALDDLEQACRQSAAHLLRTQGDTQESKSAGTRVFIGHGRAIIWRELKDFIEDRLGLPVEEFNSESTAGVSTQSRLSQLLNGASFAFLIMTAEDETVDGRRNARLNVVHEVGLFQGRLGFNRAIVLLEEGCEEFSNIHGLGQIRFPKANISAIFEQVRVVLEREKLLGARR
jgi:predicted nucleotide-binding protein